MFSEQEGLTVKKRPERASTGIESIAVAIVFLIGATGFIVGYSLLSEFFGSKLAGGVGGVIGFIGLPLLFLGFLSSIWFVGSLFLYGILHLNKNLKNIKNSYISNGLRFLVLLPIVSYLAVCSVSLLFMVLPNLYFSLWLVDTFNLSGFLANGVMFLNMLVGFIGLGIMDALDGY